MKLPTYIPDWKIIVMAAQIQDIRKNEMTHGYTMELLLPDGKVFKQAITDKYHDRYSPIVGGYYLRKRVGFSDIEHGYLSAEIFDVLFTETGAL